MVESETPRSLYLNDRSLGLATDLYELTMAAGYFDGKHNPVATFELFVRSLPRGRSFLVAAGLEQALHYLQSFRLTQPDISYLRRLPVFRHVSREFFEYLARLRFSGDLWALPEGTVFFQGEPVLRVTAPIIEAQIVETYLLSTINFQVSIASKAARVNLAAGGKNVIEFGSRRAHGMQAGILAARAGYLGGCIGTSNVLASRLLGMPAFGTMAHSFVMAFGDEMNAFRKYQECFPDSSILLVDTYDCIDAVQKLIQAGIEFQGIRLDSGDLVSSSKRIRRMLNHAGRQRVRILASGDLDEREIQRVLRQGAPIDAFGVGTHLSTSSDQPALGGVYKLVAIRKSGRDIPCAKFSPQKRSLPGIKQVYRSRSKEGVFLQDWLSIQSEIGPTGSQPLLAPVMRGGEQISPLPSLAASRKLLEEQINALPEALRDLERDHAFPVKTSPRLRSLESQEGYL